MKLGILWLVIVIALSYFLFAGEVQAQCPGPNCYVGQTQMFVQQPIMSAPVYRYVPQQIGTMQYVPRPRYAIRYPTPIRSWLFGSYFGGGYSATFIPRQ